jgi:hypothetical protein
VGWASKLAAFIGPLIVLGATYLALSTFRDADERQAEENAGRIFNADVVKGGAVAAMDRALAARTPDVIVLGPSYANTNTLPDLLAQRLGLRPADIALLSVPNSVGAHWYAMLRYRVFGAGHRPRLIVVVSGLQSALLNTPLTEASFVNLQVHLPPGPPDPEIALRVQQTTALWWARLREQRYGLRDRIFEWLRDVPTRWVFSSPRRPGPIRPDEIRVALEAVFAEERVDASLHGAAGPLVAIDRDERAYDPSVLPAPDESFLGVTTRLAADHGARVLWVRPPMSPDIAAALDDEVLPGVQERVVQLVDEAGGLYVDMRSLPMSAAHFRNVDHMNREGSRRFTEALASTILDLDALGDGATRASAGLAPRKVELHGPRSAVPADVASWAPQGRLLHPGTRLLYSFGDAWPRARGPFTVRVEVLSRGGSPEVLAADQPFALRPEPREDATAWVGTQSLTPPTGPWTLSIESSDAFARVTRLSLGSGAGAVALLGAVPKAGAEARLFGARRSLGGVMEDLSVAPSYAAPPLAPPGARRPHEPAHGPASRFDTERWSFLSDERLIGETAFGSRCSPLRVLEDGVPLPLPNVPCQDVVRRGGGRTCHSAESILFSATDGTDPDTNGRDYALALDPARACDGAAWLYPKDRFAASWPADGLAALGPEGANAFRFAARYLQHRDAPVHLRLVADGTVRIDETLSSRTLAAGAIEWPLDPPVRSGGTLEVENLEHVFYLVDEATLVGQEP